MSDFLSQEEIDALLKTNEDINPSSDESSNENTESAEDSFNLDELESAQGGQGLEDMAGGSGALDADEFGVPTGLTAVEVDALGEIGNISMATAATTLSTLLGKAVDITTPVVSGTTYQSLINRFQTPFVALQIQFAGELSGSNVLVIGVREAVIIAKLMMMQEVGSDFQTEEIGELELSAVSEAMNQMIGSASTAISTMLGKLIDIAPPITTVGKGQEVDLSLLSKDEEIIQIVFRMTIEDLVDSEIMQIYSLESAKSIVQAMFGGLGGDPAPEASMFDSMPDEDMPPVFQEGPLPSMPEETPAIFNPPPAEPPKAAAPPEQAQAPQQPGDMMPQPMPPGYGQPGMMPQGGYPQQPGDMMQQPMPPGYGQPGMMPQGGYPMQPGYGQPMYYDPQHTMPQRPQFVPLTKPQRPNQPKNIELILDVPMEMSVVLGRAERSVKQILSLGPGSIVELNKYAEEPLDIFVNGMLIGQGEVVVIEEKFGIRVNNIVSTKERAESLGTSS